MNYQALFFLILFFLISDIKKIKICTHFFSKSMLIIILPLSLIFDTILMLIYTISICLIIFPSSFIYIAISILKYTLTTCLIIFPLTLIFRTIRPLLYTKTVPIITQPFTIICCIRFKFIYWSLFTYCIWYISLWFRFIYFIIEILIILFLIKFLLSSRSIFLFV